MTALKLQSSVIGKKLPPSVDSVPENGAMHSSHCAQKAISAKLEYPVVFFITPKLGQHTCGMKEIEEF